MESFFPFVIELYMSWDKLEEKMKFLKGFKEMERPHLFCFDARGYGKLSQQSNAWVDEKRLVVVLIGHPGMERHTISGPFDQAMEVGALITGVTIEEFKQTYENAQMAREIFEKQLELDRRQRQFIGGKGESRPTL